MENTPDIAMTNLNNGIDEVEKHESIETALVQKQATPDKVTDHK
jgi:hypothetical protein